MFHRKLDRQDAGKPITARTLNRIMELLEKVANLRVSPPLALADTPAGPQIYLNTAPIWAWGTTPSGGYSGGNISAPASNTNAMTLYPIPGNTSATISVSVTYSVYAGSIGTSSSKTALYNKSTDGKWYIITADC